MRRPFALLALLLTLLATACGGEDDAATVPNPTYFKGSSVEEPQGGFEVDLVNEIASRLGIAEVTWLPFPVNGLVAGAPCPCDFSVGGVSIFPDRQEVVDFSAPYSTEDHERARP